MKDIIYRIIAFLMLLLLLPLSLIFYILVKTTSKGSFLFKQKRLGKNKKIFTLYKIRTMFEEADQLKESYFHLNEVDGPVFKIRDDPRYTKVGKFLSHTGLDELPQLINIIKGEMSFVGPRPLPVEEALKIPQKYETRFSVLPGMTSLWIVKGAHKLPFDSWMRLDLEYVKDITLLNDFFIITKTFLLIIKLVFMNFKEII